MKARPILFSGPMIRALLDGRKSQTRRAINPQPTFNQIYDWKGKRLLDVSSRQWCWKQHVFGRYPDEWMPQLAELCPYGKPGDLLWVRESIVLREGKRGDRIIVDQPQFAADGAPVMDGNGYASNHTFSPAKRKAVPSIHMLRWASRLTLRITEVRVQRLQEISEADADAEGFGGEYPDRVMPDVFPDRDGGWGSLSIPQCYARLWEHIHGPGSWDANPYVWALTFDVIKANVDSYTAARNAVREAA